MSHGRTEIDLADGLTVLTGPNNCGKSAVVAALQIIATNGKSNHVMRHGEKKCRITVEADDGHVICWERKKTVVKYTLDGEDIHRVGASVPDSVQDVLRLNPVEAKVGKTEHEYDIHFGEQKSPVFLLDQPGGRAASFFASSSDASRLVEMQHLHRKNVREQKSEAKRLQDRQQVYSQRLEHYQPLSEISQRVDQATNLLEQLDSANNQRQRLKELSTSLQNRQQQRGRYQLQLQLLDRLNTATTTPDELQQAQSTSGQLRSTISHLSEYLHQRNLYEKLAKCLNDLTAPPPMEPAESCRRLLDALRNEATRQSHFGHLSKGLAPLQSVPDFTHTSNLEIHIRKLKAAHTRTHAVRSVCDAVEPLKVPPAQHATGRVRQIVSELQQRMETTSRLALTVTMLDPLTPPQEPVDSALLANTIKRLATSLKETESTSARADMAIWEASDCEEKIRSFVAANPKCAMCGADINPDTLLSNVPNLHHHSSPDAADCDDSVRSVSG